jgi:hypothetical protein
MQRNDMTLYDMSYTVVMWSEVCVALGAIKGVVFFGISRVEDRFRKLGC